MILTQTFNSSRKIEEKLDNIFLFLVKNNLYSK